MRRILHPTVALAVAAALAAPASLQAAPSLTRLNATVGPGFTITLTKGGKKVKTLKPGRYRIVIRDRSTIHDFHLVGPGLNRSTSVAGTGTTTWTVRLKKGTYRFVCDPHSGVMHGSFRVR